MTGSTGFTGLRPVSASRMAALTGPIASGNKIGNSFKAVLSLRQPKNIVFTRMLHFRVADETIFNPIRGLKIDLDPRNPVNPV